MSVGDVRQFLAKVMGVKHVEEVKLERLFRLMDRGGKGRVGEGELMAGIGAVDWRHRCREEVGKYV